MSVRITVTGVEDLVSYMNRVSNGIEPQVVTPASKDAAQDVVNKMVKVMHKRSGRMVSSTRTQKVQGGYSAVVDVPYAEQENMRRGNKRTDRGTGFGTPHRFVPNVNEIADTAFTNLLFRITQLLQSA